MGCLRNIAAKLVTRIVPETGFVLAVAATFLVGAEVLAQTPPRAHYLHHEFLPPGVIGQEQLRKHAGMAGYFQAVELIVPEGTQVSLMDGGQFCEPVAGPVLAGLQLGYVYSIKLTRLPNREGVEIFPTVELINRLYPPEGTKTRFPVPIEITNEDISHAVSGLFVTRVVYLEDPDQALPRADKPGEQRSFDVSPTEDPLHVADRLGRPMAIVRIGSRVPADEELAAAGWSCAPIQIYPPLPAVTKPARLQDAIERHGSDVPRDDAATELRPARLGSGRRIPR